MSPDAANRSSRFQVVAALLVLLLTNTIVVAAIERRLRPTFGAVGHYYAQTAWRGPVRVRTIDPDLTTRRLEQNWPWIAEPFSVRWDGFLWISQADTFQFASSSDDGSVIVVDDEIVVDNGGAHEERMVVGERTLERGLHRIRVEYFQAGGGRALTVSWARRGGRWRPLSGPNLLAAVPSAGSLRSWDTVRRARDALGVLTTCVSFAAIVAFVVFGPVRALIRRELGGPLPRDTLRLLAVASFVFAVGLWWGLPGPGWAADEVGPDDYATALDERFSNGWWSRYPPGHYELVITASAPVWLLRAWDRTSYADRWGEQAVFFIARASSLLLSVGAVLMAYLCGRRIGGHHAALVSATLFALSPPVVYYAKVANLDAPYLFWYTIALLAFLRLYEDPARRTDLLLYASAATIAICTKDQAYGLFVAPSIAILWWRWRRQVRRPREIAQAVLLATVIFAAVHNLIFNWSGFVEHLRAITGSQSQYFRVFEPGIAGQSAMAVTSGRLLAAMIGWPGLLLAATGAAIAVARRAGERSLRGLLAATLLPPLSYYLTFIAVVGYTYDRFLVPVLLTLALFAGAGAAALAARGGIVRRAGIIATTAAIGLLAGRALLVDLAMVRDSRYQIEEWMSAHARAGETVAAVGLTEFLPRLDAYHVVRFVIPDREGIHALQAEAVMLNTEYLRRFVPGDQRDGVDQFVDTFETYRVAARIRTALPLERLSYRTALGGLESFSNLSKINPAMVVLRRVAD